MVSIQSSRYHFELRNRSKIRNIVGSLVKLVARVGRLVVSLQRSWNDDRKADGNKGE